MSTIPPPPPPPPGDDRQMPPPDRRPALPPRLNHASPAPGGTHPSAEHPPGVEVVLEFRQNLTWHLISMLVAVVVVSLAIVGLSLNLLPRTMSPNERTLAITGFVAVWVLLWMVLLYRTTIFRATVEPGALVVHRAFGRQRFPLDGQVASAQVTRQLHNGREMRRHYTVVLTPLTGGKSRDAVTFTSMTEETFVRLMSALPRA